MYAQRILSVVLILVGILALAYGGFSYTKQTHEADVGPVHMSVDEKEYVNVPVFAGVGFVVVGALLLFIPRKI